MSAAAPVSCCVGWPAGSRLALQPTASSLPSATTIFASSGYIDRGDCPTEALI